MNVHLINVSQETVREGQEGQSYLLQGHAPHTVLPTPIRASGAQTEAAVMERVAGWRAWHGRRRLHLHGRDIEQSIAEAGPVVGGVHTQDAPCFTWRRTNDDNKTHLSWKVNTKSHFYKTTAPTCALELPSPHAFSRSGALGAV